MGVFSHGRIWAAIDALAARNSLSPSALAKRAGLDATAFNRSKRRSPEGRPRWPSTESIAKVLEATGASIDEFVSFLRHGDEDSPGSAPARLVPLIGFAQAGAGGFFDDAGFPAGHGWEEIAAPFATGNGAYALAVQGDSMMPLYRDGDVLIIDPEARIRQGDRIVARTRGGEVMAKVLKRLGPDRMILSSLNPDHPDREFGSGEVEWTARIVWASQ
jgi:phage repressor protein C with HTH and peptisase S24 domain